MKGLKFNSWHPFVLFFLLTFSLCSFAQPPSQDWEVNYTTSDAYGEDAQDESPNFRFDDDLYENIFYNQQSAAYTDIRFVRTGFDDNYIYVEVEFVSGFSSAYQGSSIILEIDHDPEHEANRPDFYLSIYMKQSFAQPFWVDAQQGGGYEIFEDGNNDVGGNNPLASDERSNDNGYEQGVQKVPYSVQVRVVNGNFQFAIAQSLIPDNGDRYVRATSAQDGHQGRSDFSVHDNKKENQIQRIDNSAPAGSENWTPIDVGGDIGIEIDLALEKSVDNETPQVGVPYTYSITLSHASIETATAVEVTMQTTGGLDFVSATPSQGAYNPFSRIWDVGDIPPGVSPVLALTVQARPEELGKHIVSSAEITAVDQTDPALGNNQGYIDVKVAGHDGLLEYVEDITGFNPAPVPVAGDDLFIKVNDPDLSLNPLFPEFTTVRITSQETGDGVDLWLTELENESFDFTGLVSTQLGWPNYWDNVVQVAINDCLEVTYNDAIDSNADENVQRDALICFGQPQISLLMEADKVSALPGEEITYSISFKNLGEVASSNVKIQEHIPQYTVYVADSLRIGTSDDDYDSAVALSDALDGYETLVNEALIDGVFASDYIRVLVSEVAALDEDQATGPDQGRIFFKVTIVD